LEGSNYFTHPALLEFVAENPTRRGTLPRNIGTVAKIVLDAGGAADRESLDSALALAASSSIARECGVQEALIDVLCDYGADPNGAVLPALYHGAFDGASALLRAGAKDDLAIAAATGRADDARDLLAASGDETRQRALALAAQFGHREIVRMLLDAGEDPNRYSPPGGHSHATPLHQAALAGHDAVARLLVERGARLDIEDVHYHGTPGDWAAYAGHAALAEELGYSAS
jgi:ankyrin repeat protein